jgi:hypothetical protein
VVEFGPHDADWPLTKLSTRVDRCADVVRGELSRAGSAAATVDVVFVRNRECRVYKLAVVLTIASVVDNTEERSPVGRGKVDLVLGW